MTSEDLYQAINELDDDILERSEASAGKRKTKSGLLKWGAMAACLCLTAVGVFTAVHPWKASRPPVPNPDGVIDRGPEPGEYPPVNIVPGFALDEPDSACVFFNDIDAAPVGETAMIALMADDFCPMSAEESLDYFGVTLPENGIVPGVTLTGGGCFGNGHGVYRSESRDVYYDVNFYEFTGSGKSVTLTLHRLFNMTPSPEQVANGPEHIEFTEFCGWKLALFRYSDENGIQRVYTEFVLDGVTYTISACGLEGGELAAALMNLLPPVDYVPDPVAVTGTVVHVDSRTSDYFDGTEHHYSEDHDYITVDCGGTRLTVWLPGKADSFSVGDIVIVTYNGEPATAYNIWPGQLVGVE